jgi:cold shock CspA family protein
MLSTKGDWGFVKCASVQGDVFLGMRENPALGTLPAVGDALTFELTVDPKSGRHKALNAQPSLAGRRMQGTVTQVKDAGWGFARTEGVEGNVMLGKRNLTSAGIERLTSGDVLEFDLTQAAKGYEATNIQMIQQSAAGF